MIVAQPRSDKLVSHSDPQTLLKIRHTCAHVLAMAVQTLFPESKVTIGPGTDTGFYYDFDRKTPFTPDDLSQIETEMRRIIGANLPIIREECDRPSLRSEIEELGEPYKLEILDGIPHDAIITRYFIGSPDAGRTQHPEVEPSLLESVSIPPSEYWWDLCAGPHLAFTGDINPEAFALESVLLPVSADQRKYAESVAATQKQQGFRVELDQSGERLGKQIRKAELEKIPVVAVVGKREAESQTLSVRTRHAGDLGALTLEDLQGKLEVAIAQKSIIQ